MDYYTKYFKTGFMVTSMIKLLKEGDKNKFVLEEGKQIASTLYMVFMDILKMNGEPYPSLSKLDSILIEYFLSRKKEFTDKSFIEREEKEIRKLKRSLEMLSSEQSITEEERKSAIEIFGKIREYCLQKIEEPNHSPYK